MGIQPPALTKKYRAAWEASGQPVLGQQIDQLGLPTEITDMIPENIKQQPLYPTHFEYLPVPHEVKEQLINSGFTWDHITDLVEMAGQVSNSVIDRSLGLQH